MESFRLALWATNLSPRLRSLDDWLERVRQRAGRAAASGARLLVLPEYVCEAWLGFKPAGLPPDREIAWMAGIAGEALPGLRRIAGEAGIALLPGTMPRAQGDGYRNRAWLITADGRLGHQDKLCLTPFERDPATWLLEPGDTLQVFDLGGLRVVILVCLDVEMPALSCRLAPQRPDLLLVPSMTTQSGHGRVFGCARARAVELMCAVACTGVVGVSPGTTQNDSNISGNAVFLPCEPELGYTGRLLETPATNGLDGTEPFDVVDLPIATLRRLRSAGGEVWPGAWTADHVTIGEGWSP